MIYKCKDSHPTKCARCLWNYGIDHKHHLILNHYHNIHKGVSTRIHHNLDNETEPFWNQEPKTICPITNHYSVTMNLIKPYKKEIE